MRKIGYAIIFLVFLFNPMRLFSAEDVSFNSEDLDSLRDPFTPQLPLPPTEETEKPMEIQKLPEQKVEKKVPQLPSPPPKPMVEEPIKPPEVKIVGLIWNTDHPQAIVNDRIVQVGDQIGEWKIQKIDRDGIEISFQDKKIFIPTSFGVQGSSPKKSVTPQKQSSERKI